MEFSDKRYKHPLVRAALLLANLTTDNKEDGFARALTAAQIKTVVSKSNLKAAA